MEQLDHKNLAAFCQVFLQMQYLIEPRGLDSFATSMTTLLLHGLQHQIHFHPHAIELQNFLPFLQRHLHKKVFSLLTWFYFTSSPPFYFSRGSFNLGVIFP